MEVAYIENWIMPQAPPSGYHCVCLAEVGQLCVAGVPGMVGGMLRHLRSLRDMKRDHGWIHTLLEEAENERMHLLTFLQLRQPGLFFRLFVLGAQGVFFNFYFVAYLLSPKFCHRFVGKCRVLPWGSPLP